MIIKEPHTKYTIVSICNYDNYQNITTTEKQQNLQQKNNRTYNRKTTEPTQTKKEIQLTKKKRNKKVITEASSVYSQFTKDMFL